MLALGNRLSLARSVSSAEWIPRRRRWTFAYGIIELLGLMIQPTPLTVQPAQKLKFRTPAKINLVLSVGGLRADGFHVVDSLAAGVSLFDDLEFMTTRGTDTELRCSDPAIPTDDRNLVIAAARALRLDSSIRSGVQVDLTKRIPVAAGLGGGSGNAAGTLTALNQIWDLGHSIDELKQIGATLGSDVPMFFDLPVAVVCGRGEQSRAATMRWTGWAVLAFAGCSVSTREVYAACAGDDATLGGAQDRIAAALSATSAAQLSACCVNDLEPVVFRVAPRVEELWAAIHGLGWKGARVSGAGQAVYTLFDDQREAEASRDKLSSSGIGNVAVTVKVGVAAQTL